MELRISEIKSLEPDFENGVIYGTLKTGEKFKLNVSVDKIEKVYTKLKNKIYGKFKEGEEGIPRKPSDRKLYTNLETGETLTAKEFSEKYNYVQRSFQAQIAKSGKYRGMSFAITTKPEKKEKIYTFIRVRDNKKMSLKEICYNYQIDYRSASTLLRVYGRINLDRFAVYCNGKKIEPRRKTKIFLNIETKAVGPLTFLAKVLNIENEKSFIAQVLKIKQYKNYHFELQGEC